MRKKTKYTNEQLGRLEIVDDFLPSPDELVFRDDEVTVTLRLRKSSVEFYKHLTKANKIQHERVIRRLLDQYASRHAGEMSGR